MISYRPANRSPREISNVAALIVLEPDSLSALAQWEQNRLLVGFSVWQFGHLRGASLIVGEAPGSMVEEPFLFGFFVSLPFMKSGRLYIRTG